MPWIIIAILVIAVVIVKLVDEKQKAQLKDEAKKAKAEQPSAAVENAADVETAPDFDVSAYQKKLLLTKNEWIFYKSLKPIADELGFCVLAKIRVADLVDVKPANKADWQKYFNRINKKHIDFALAKPDNLQIMLLIELDDSSHNAKQAERDKFIEAVYTKTGYKLLRTRGEADLKAKIEEAVALNK